MTHERGAHMPPPTLNRQTRNAEQFGFICEIVDDPGAGEDDDTDRQGRLSITEAVSTRWLTFEPFRGREDEPVCVSNRTA